MEAAITNFLAFHAYEIGNAAKESHFLELNYENEQQIEEAMREPSKYKSIMSWKTDEKLNQVILETPENFTVIRVLVNGKENIYKISSFELYVKVKLPWGFVKKDQNIIVLLTMREKQLIKDGLIVDFYPVGENYEIILVDQEQRKNIISNTIASILKHCDIKPEINKVIIFKFIEGDHEILVASDGFIRKDCYEIVDIDSLQNEQYYENIKNIEYPIVIISLFPNSNNQISVSILGREK